MRTIKKGLAWFIATLMVLMTLPTTALAEKDDNDEHGRNHTVFTYHEREDGSGKTWEKEHHNGDKIIIKNETELGFSNPGHTIEYWIMYLDTGHGPRLKGQYAPGQESPPVNPAHYQLYLHWIELTEYTLAYNKNTDDTVTNMPTSGTYDENATANVDAETIPVRTGYTFAGWAHTEGATALAAGDFAAGAAGTITRLQM